MKEEGIRIIENFITKDEPIMEFEEMQAVVEMIYEIYKTRIQTNLQSGFIAQ